MYLKQGIFNFERGQELAEIGLELAVEGANKEHKDWGTRCWQLFLVWLRRNVKRGQEFQVEDYRSHVFEMDLLEMPNSLRAFGIIAKRGQGKYFEFVRKDKTKSVRGHGANASVWRKL